MGTDAARVERPRGREVGASLLLFAGLTVCALALGARIATLNFTGFDGDEFAFALVARDVLHGKLPYAGVFDDKPVGLTYVFALAEWLGNQSVASVHAVGLVSAGLAAGLLYATGRQLRLARAMSVALAGLFGFEVLLLDGWASMSELVAAPLICTVNLLILRQRPANWRGCVVLGLLFGVIGQISYLALPGLALTALSLLRPGSPREGLRKVLAIGAGFGVAVFVVWLPQILTGDWLPYLETQVQFYGRYRLAPQPFTPFLYGFLAPVLVIAFPLLLIGFWNVGGVVARKALPPSFWPLLLQLAGMLLSACAPNRYYPHYLILCLPALTALIALFVKAGPAGRESLAAVVLLIWGAVAGVMAAQYLPKRLDTPIFEKTAAQLVDRLVGPGRRLLIFNAEPSIYFLSGSQPVERYVFPSEYLRSCASVVEMKSPVQVIADGLRAHPDLILSGTDCDTDLDAQAMFRRAGYALVGKVVDGDREIEAYAPIGPASVPAPQA